MSDTEVHKKVTDIFTNYLIKNKHRKTPERYAILNEIYQTNGHFDVEDMYLRMKTNNYRVSRATLYNTIEILLDCKLIRKHQFGKIQAQYETSFRSRQHDHIICSKCDNVIEFCDPRIQNIKDSIFENMNFIIEYHSLNFYGICRNCQKNKI